MPTTLFLWYLPYVEYILERGKFMDERREVSEEEYVKGVTNKHRVFFEGKRAIDCLFLHSRNHRTLPQTRGVGGCSVCLNSCWTGVERHENMAKLAHCYTEDDGRHDDGLTLVRRRPANVPRAMSRNYFPLALPPSTNCPAAYVEMYTLSSTTYINNSPSLIGDVVPRILSFCDAITLSRASGVCRSWRIMANADELWTELCKEGECAYTFWGHHYFVRFWSQIVDFIYYIYIRWQFC